jgi:hypothetical protein
VTSVRVMFFLYLAVILAGIVLATVSGLTHH